MLFFSKFWTIYSEPKNPALKQLLFAHLASSSSPEIPSMTSAKQPSGDSMNSVHS